tara:strand:- start:48170 stop:48412 length:243 start_codon:yes stop_codon:yes gene_type:complete
MPNQKKKRSPVVCLCNSIRQDIIEATIRQGNSSVDDIYDQTTAGVGPCGGSCRPYIKEMIAQFEKDGTFPEVARPIKKRK